MTLCFQFVYALEKSYGNVYNAKSGSSPHPAHKARLQACVLGVRTVLDVSAVAFVLLWLTVLEPGSSWEEAAQATPEGAWLVFRDPGTVAGAWSTSLDLTGSQRFLPQSPCSLLPPAALLPWGPQQLCPEATVRAGCAGSPALKIPLEAQLLPHLRALSTVLFCRPSWGNGEGLPYNRSGFYWELRPQPSAWWGDGGSTPDQSLGTCVCPPRGK